MAKATPSTPAFDFELVVIHQFGANERGTRIADPEQIAAVLAGENAHHCHKVAKPQ